MGISASHYSLASLHHLSSETTSFPILPRLSLSDSFEGAASTSYFLRPRRSCSIVLFLWDARRICSLRQTPFAFPHAEASASLLGVSSAAGRTSRPFAGSASIGTANLSGAGFLRRGFSQSQLLWWEWHIGFLSRGPCPSSTRSN